MLQMDCIEVLRHPLLKRAYHASWTYNGKIYLHGGLIRNNSNEEPLGDVVEIDLTSRGACELSCKGHGPKRSHHKCIIIEAKWACFIGGWDGRQRATEVCALNLESLEWVPLVANVLCDPPAGLSSHTCTKVGHNEVIITGREGGIRMQRRYGSVYKLTIDIQSRSFTYKEMPMHISSRSGHIACMLDKDSGTKVSSKLSLIVHGGRDSDAAEIVGSWAKSQVNLPPAVFQLEAKLKSFFLPSNTIDKGEKPSEMLVATKSRSLRHHAAIEAGKFCLVHGGEVFGKARDTVSGDIFVHNSSATKWWTAGSGVLRFHPQSDEGLLKRMGHSIFYIDGLLYIVSGIGSNGKTAEGSVCSVTL